MIPKIIHYCWFGRNPKPRLAKKCIKSWKKCCLNYKIIEWNEDNFDISVAPLYVRQAYEAKKWAFVTDYVRLWAMVNYGGIYMDTDVEVIKPLDQFLHHEAFSGFENEVDIPTGIMACEKNYPLFDEFLKYYEKAQFINDDGSLNMTTNVRIMTDICIRHGLKQNGMFQIVDGFALYPKEVFCPIGPCADTLVCTEKTATIHWFSGSWLSGELKQKKMEAKRRTRRNKVGNVIHNIIHLPNRIVRNIVGNDMYDRLKKWIK